MQWQETNADLALDRQRELLAEAYTRRLAQQALTDAPRYREWLARQLVVLALRLAPSVRVSLRGLLVDEITRPAPVAPPAGGRSMKPLT